MYVIGRMCLLFSPVMFVKTYALRPHDGKSSFGTHRVCFSHKRMCLEEEKYTGKKVKLTESLRSVVVNVVKQTRTDNNRQNGTKVERPTKLRMKIGEKG